MKLLRIHTKMRIWGPVGAVWTPLRFPASNVILIAACKLLAMRRLLVILVELLAVAVLSFQAAITFQHGGSLRFLPTCHWWPLFFCCANCRSHLVILVLDGILDYTVAICCNCPLLIGTTLSGFYPSRDPKYERNRTTTAKARSALVKALDTAGSTCSGCSCFTSAWAKFPKDVFSVNKATSV